MIDITPNLRVNFSTFQGRELLKCAMRGSEGKFPHQQRPPYFHRLIDKNGKTGKKKNKIG